MFISCGSGAATRGLPVFLPTTEAAAAGDPDTCVWEIDGAANAPLTGVGGPNTGANLVLTPFGNTPAAAGGYVALSGHVMGYSLPTAALNALLGGVEGTVAWLVRNLARDNSYNISVAGQIAAHVWTGGLVDVFANPSAGLVTGGQGIVYPKTPVSLTVPTWLVWTFKQGVGCVMVSEAGLPTSYADVAADNRVVVSSVAPFTTFGTDIIGRSTASAAANFDIGRLVISRKAIGLPVI